jgi:uncharacterized membrane protein
VILSVLLSQLPIKLPAISYVAIGPEIILFGGALLVLLLSATLGRREHPELYRVIGLVAALGEAAWGANRRKKEKDMAKVKKECGSAYKSCGGL